MQEKNKNRFFDFISKKINRSNERSTNAIKNIIASFGIKGVSIVVQLLLVPMTIHYVNPTQYGIWLTLSSIIGWFSFFDIGFGNGLRNRFAEAKATGNYAKAKAYVSTTYICIGTVFVIVWILFFCINFFLDWSIILNAPAQMAKELSVVALIVISFFCLQMVFQLINTVLIADQKSAKSAFFHMIGQVLALIIIFILTKITHGSLIYLASALGFCPILVLLIVSWWFYKKDYRLFKPKISLFHKGIVKDIFSLGSKFFVTQVAMLIIYSTANIIISQQINPYEVTVYNIAYKYFNVIIMIFSIIQSTMWSSFTDAWIKRDILWINNSLKKLQQIWLLLVVLTFIFLVVANKIYSLWVGKNIIVPYLLSINFSLFTIIGNWSSIWGNFLNGIGKIKLQTYICFVKCLCFIPLALFFCKLYGTVGLVVSFIIISVPDMILYPLQTKKILDGKAKGIWNE
ncbi:O-antigen export protein [Bacteroidia bacterium]|nr:O-antigen export protein [Bacteroidia bacterium]